MITFKSFRGLLLALLLSSTLLSSCALAPVALEVVIWVGNIALRTAVAELVEKSLDKWFGGDSGSNSAADFITPSVFNSLEGTLVEKYLHIDLSQSGVSGTAEAIYIPRDLLRFQRTTPTSSDWKLSPDSQQLVSERIQIASAQLSLKKLGFYKKKIDGIPGKGTEKAVEKFQKRVSISPATGLLDEATRNALFQYAQ